MAEEHKSSDETIDVAYVARLARLNLSEAEMSTFQRQLGDIVGYVHKISQLDLSGIEPTSHAIPVQNVFRDDKCGPGIDRAAVMQNAPEHSDDQFLVPKIVE